MAAITCKMCGAPLKATPGVTVTTCDFCGREQTVPSMDNEKKLTLFARAERLRTACEFDKAAGIFEAIVAEFPQEAEAYWGLVLCKYGIEYVDDPATGEKIPTCHRSSFDSIFDDADYEQAYDNADTVSRKVYRAEAKRIEEVRRGIISVSAKEDPYDIFICYKETAEDGGRTLDSVLAQDIYDALTDRGYRVFFARITLEDKLGQEYEPYIFAALNSARIMLAVGTDFEYYNAVWVKNEWSRFLKLMAQDHNKYLIPCFKGLDAYDMPKEFARLQAQDLGKVGAMQDLLRGIEKILPRIKAPIQEISNNRTQEKNNASPMVMRGQFALEDGDFAKANEFFEKALDQNPQDGGAYLGKVLSALRLTNVQQIDERVIKLHDDKDYERAIRFSDPATSKTLTEIRDRAHRKYLVKCLTVGLKKIIVKKRPIEERMQREAERQEQIKLQQEQEKMAQYIHACQLLENSTDPVSLKQAGYIFRALIGFKDSQQKEVQCVEKAEQFRKKQIYTESYEQLLQTRELNRSLQERIQLARRAASGFASIRGYSNSESLLENSNHTLEVYSKQLEAEQQHRAAEEAAQKARIAQVSRWQAMERCQHCGGEFKGLFTKKCSNCGTPKDY